MSYFLPNIISLDPVKGSSEPHEMLLAGLMKPTSVMSLAVQSATFMLTPVRAIGAYVYSYTLHNRVLFITLYLGAVYVLHCI